MYSRKDHPYGVYGSLPMQAALGLYLPHVEEPAGPSRRTGISMRTAGRRSCVLTLRRRLHLFK